MAITKKKCSKVDSYIFIVFSSLAIPIFFFGLFTFPNNVVVYGLHYDGVNQNPQVIEIIDHFKTPVSNDRRSFDNLLEYNNSRSTNKFLKGRDGREDDDETHRHLRSQGNNVVVHHGIFNRRMASRNNKTSSGQDMCSLVGPMKCLTSWPLDIIHKLIFGRAIDASTGNMVQDSANLDKSKSSTKDKLIEYKTTLNASQNSKSKPNGKTRKLDTNMIATDLHNQTADKTLNDRETFVHKFEHFNRRKHDLYMKKNLTITCPEIGNVTFKNTPPFNVLGIPQCGNKVKPKFRLYLPMNEELKINASECDLVPMGLPNENTSSCFKQLDKRRDIGKIVLIIHGFLNGFNTDWMHEMQRDIQRVDNKNTKVAAIVIGWGGGIWDILSYWRAAGNTRYIAYAMYLIVHEMHKEVTSRKLYVHCIGHSLGGQACGLSGKHLIATGGDKLKYDRISGMDPAGPLFCEDIPYPFDYKYIDPKARIGPTDAHFVDVIHTDGGARYLQWIPQYGTMMALGTVDFYPGESPDYGCYQPGCYDHLIDIESCSHSRSHLLYSTSIKQTICLAAAKCEGDPHHIPHNCEALNKKSHEHGFSHLNNKAQGPFMNNVIQHRSSIAMGYWMDLSLTGLYTVNVTGSEPYCI